jgi:hypothetical protein
MGDGHAANLFIGNEEAAIGKVVWTDLAAGITRHNKADLFANRILPENRAAMRGLLEEAMELLDDTA